MQYRTTGTRLATAVTTVIAVTGLGVGTLAMAPASFAAAPAAVRAAVPAAQNDTLPVIAEAAELGGIGPSGFLTYSFSREGDRTLLWTPFDGSAPVPLGQPEGWSIGGGDVVALGDASWTAEMDVVRLRNMADPSAPAVEIDLRPVNGFYVAVLGPDSVLAQVRKADGTAELRIVTKDGAETTDRAVTGLPADATDFLGSKSEDGKVLVGYETGPQGARTGGRALVDLATGTVTETYASLESGYGFSELQFSGSHVAWVDYDSASGLYVTSVDRTTKERKKTVLGARDSLAYAGLIGSWLVYGNPSSAAPEVKAVDLATGETRVLAARGSSVWTPGDGTLVLQAERAAGDEGLFRVEAGTDGAPALTAKVAAPAVVEPLTIDRAEVPGTVDLDGAGGKVAMSWTLSRPDASLLVRLTHVATGKEYVDFPASPAEDGNFSLEWDGLIDGVDAPNGAYTVTAEAELHNHAGDTVRQTRQLTLTRTANAHDYSDNGSVDVLARDAAGVLWRDDLLERPADGAVATAERAQIGPGWNTYKHIEAVGNLGGAAHPDLVAVDGGGILWRYLGKGDGTFTARVQVGGGWQVYNKITGGSDLDGDGRADLLATDASGVLWFYKGTGDLSRPYDTRAQVGGGWQVYNQLTAVGNIAGTAAGDLVARDAEGVLWLYQGNGRGGFAGRVKVGGGWQVFSQLVGGGDADNDGSPDLIAHGANGTYVYRSNGTTTGTFTRLNTDLYAGEGGKFTSVA
ncbi:FG-GAP-like repeat-containing protein [Streptomyces sp. NPDC058757]|uniref:FG-GAP-like repeat-containing protein n=1 Tax=Streptomyces sp. NPDC058757 TaxID=3346626 RepID=UPI0036972517